MASENLRPALGLLALGLVGTAAAAVAFARRRRSPAASGHQNGGHRPTRRVRRQVGGARSRLT